MLLPGYASIDNAIIVTGFDDDTKEEELIEFYYRIVYGGGTRNVNDGKVRSCHIYPISISQESQSDGSFDELNPIEHRVAIITFADS